MSDSAFVTLTLADIAEFCNGKGISPSLYSPYGKYPVFGSNGQIARTDELLNPSPVIVVGRVGAFCGSVYRVDEPSWTTDNAIVVKPQPHIDFGFLYYRLKSLDINRTAIGSAQPLVTQGGLKIIQILVPSLPEQKLIAYILGTLDDKIELNQQMNRNLEAIAQAMFKSWFIDFDPVLAKVEGRQPAGMDAATAALFPDSFEDSPLGEIPKGWRVIKLADICSTQYGYTASAKNDKVGTHLLRVMDINKQNWIEWANVPFCEISEADLAKYSLKVGDIVVARMADPGKAAIVEQAVNAVFASYLVRLKTESLSLSYYVYHFLKSSLYKAYTAGAQSGSVQANMNAKVITAVDLILPQNKLLCVFLDRILPIRKQIITNVEQSCTLATIRDTLLPKLMSGEIRVKEAEEILENVA
jgi:type I restriction enzyme S subunit